MSQSGYIYALTNVSTNGIVKIGKTQRDPEGRAKELSSATGVPTPFIVVYQAYFNDCDKAEIFVHTKLEKYRVANNREFFQVSIPVAVDTIIEAKNYYAKTENTLDLSKRESQPFETNQDGESLEPGREIFELGEAYYYGHDDIIEDYAEAFNYYEKAARLGYAEAFLQMGIMYRDGQGRNSDSKRALECFKEAIKHGNDEGWAEMASIFHTDGHQENEAKCWNKYFTSKEFLEYKPLQSLRIYHYINARIGQNKPLEYKDQIRQVKTSVLNIINGMEKQVAQAQETRPEVRSNLIEKYKKISEIVKEL
jgi:hypothetical protein